MKANVILGVVALLPLTLMAETTKLDAKDLLTRLHNVNQEEISAGLLAREQAQSAKVKAYAEQLIKDHTKADAQVAALAKEEGINLEASMPSSVGEAGQSVKKAATLSQLKLLSGAQFDRAFIKSMEGGHESAIHLLETSEVDDAKVKRLAKKLLPELKEHHKIAHSLAPTVEAE